MAEWSSPSSEWISLIQIATRIGQSLQVYVFDAHFPWVRKLVTPILISPHISKAFHNASFDVNKFHKHWGVASQNCYCTMSAARKAGHKKYSLKDLAQNVLNLQLNKTYQHSDFGLRPLHPDQIKYAAEDAKATLLLFEHQKENSQAKRYFLNTPALPFSDLRTAIEKIIALKPGILSPESVLANCLGPRSGIFGYYLSEAIGERIPDEKEIKEVLATFTISDRCLFLASV